MVHMLQCGEMIEVVPFGLGNHQRPFCLFVNFKMCHVFIKLQFNLTSTIFIQCWLLSIIYNLLTVVAFG